jgi:beta-xylosidase
VDKFAGETLGPAWQWNHNPDTTKFSLHNPGLTLHTATVTADLYAARNTLTRCLHGVNPYGVVEIDFSNMADGDHAELAALKDASAWIGIVRHDTEYCVVVTHGLAMGTYRGTTSTRTTPIIRTKVWLKVSLDAAAVGSHKAHFFYSLDGSIFIKLGDAYTLTTDYLFFMGYRYGIFNYAPQALGGSVDVLSFAIECS